MHACVSATARMTSAELSEPGACTVHLPPDSGICNSGHSAYLPRYYLLIISPKKVQVKSARAGFAACVMLGRDQEAQELSANFNGTATYVLLQKKVSMHQFKSCNLE
jgi:hypothetical protein